MELTTILLFGAACLTWAAITGIRRIWFSPLSKFPGPKLNALTLWTEFYWDVVKRGSFMWRIQEMHETYGPIVRINPYEVHILDPDFYGELYSNRKLDKYKWWTNLAGADRSSFATVSHDLHRLRRGPLNPFFSARSVVALEPMIRAKIEKLSARFHTLAETGEVIRLDAAFMALTMDIICDYAFARDRKYLDDDDFNLQWKQTIIGSFEGGAIGRHFPFMLPLMKRLPRSVLAAMDGSVSHHFYWEGLVREQVKPILAEKRDDKDKTQDDGDSRAATIFHALRDSNLPDEEKTLDRLCDEALILTGAGSETTAQVLTRMFFYLKHVPETLVRLRKELDSIMPNITDTPSWSELQQLPYLNAIVRESLRLSYGITTRLPRVAHEDIQYGGYTIPAGTPISETPYFILTHPTIFPEPDKFSPERWLDGENVLKKSMDKYLVSFGKGTRQCAGINLAYAELYLTTATIAQRFDWEMVETTLDDVTCKHDFFVAVSQLNSKGVQRGVRARIVGRRY